MMTPQQEARDLIDRPLPLLAEDLEDLPTRIYAVEGLIEQLEIDLKAARETREEMLKMAVDNGALEDARCRIAFKERRNRILDIGRFKAAYPGQFDDAVLIIRNGFLEKAARAEEFITFGVADAVAGKDRVDAACEIVITRTPFVALKAPGRDGP